MPSESDVPEPLKRTVVGSRAVNGAVGVVCAGQLPLPSTVHPAWPGAGMRTRPDPVHPFSCAACAVAPPAAVIAPAATSASPIRLMYPSRGDRPASGSTPYAAAARASSPNQRPCSRAWIPASPSTRRAFAAPGCPLFVAGTTARTEVWTRAVPVLGLVFVGGVLGAIDLQWSTWANVGALIGGMAILLGGLALANHLRGRPLLAPPRDVGAFELAGFVLLPAVLPAIFGGQTRSAWVTAVANLAVLAVLYGTIRYGLLSIVAWAARRLGGQLAASVILLARAIPLLMLFSVVLFLTTGMWQTFARMDDASLGAIAGLLVGVGTLFLVARLPREV